MKDGKWKMKKWVTPRNFLLSCLQRKQVVKRKKPQGEFLLAALIVSGLLSQVILLLRRQIPLR
jgi:hypothetical protein